MKCPFCGALQSAVLETRVSDDSSVIRRRRRCEACDKRFTTFERADVRLPQVIKKNNVRVDYQRDKLRASFALALRKRPVTSEQIDAAIARIEERLLAQGEREVSSRKIGEMVMQELTGLDKIAYIRFASVYRNFEDVNEFSEVIQEVETQPVAQRHEDE